MSCAFLRHHPLNINNNKRQIPINPGNLEGALPPVDQWLRHTRPGEGYFSPSLMIQILSLLEMPYGIPRNDVFTNYMDIYINQA